MVRDKEKIKAWNKAYYLKNIEKSKAYMKAYYQTPAGKKTTKICSWKNQGIHVDNFDELYKKYLEATNCKKCKKKFINGKFNRLTKCADHDHNLEFNNFRAFLCSSCNSNDNSSNSSGTPNVSYDKYGNRWRYKKVINGNCHYKCFKTKQETIDYKKEYESQI